MITENNSFLSFYVRGQEHSPIRTRAPRGFCILRNQVLVLYSRQKLDPLAVKDRNMVLLLLLLGFFVLAAEIKS